MPESTDDSKTQQLTLILKDLARGKSDADSAAMSFLVGELEAIAKGYLRHQSAGHSLQPSALVNETYIKLFGKPGLRITDRAHFFTLAAKAMRQVLVSHARRRSAQRAGDDKQPLSVCASAVDGGTGVVDVLDLHLALEELTAVNARQGTVVELRFFGGLDVAEVALLLDVSKSTIEREWRFARAWLGDCLRRGQEP